MANPRFQRWAAGFPLTRRIAHRNTRTLFDLCAGFVYAQVLTACVRLDLFAILAEGPLTVDALAPRLGLSPEKARTLLLAARSLDLVRNLAGDRFALAISALPWSAIPASPQWWSTMRCSTPTSPIPSPC